MVYKHEGWTLHKRDVVLKGGRDQTIYFFSKRTPKRGTPCDMPTGYEVGVNKRTGMPYLKFAGNKVSVWKQRKEGRR